MKTLIVYATKYGCSEKCAKLLSEKILGEADLVNITKNSTPDLSLYEKVIIGGPIYMGVMNSNITEYCNNNLDSLKNKKLALFVCSMFGDNRAEENMQKAFPEDLKNIAVSMKLFGGELNISKMKFMDKLIAKMVSKAQPKPGEIINKGILLENVEELAKKVNES